ncbi:hypothetical protein [Amycolatopsis sp. NPDC059021]
MTDQWRVSDFKNSGAPPVETDPGQLRELAEERARAAEAARPSGETGR